jgi:hypothetical protein
MADLRNLKAAALSFLKSADPTGGSMTVRCLISYLMPPGEMPWDVFSAGEEYELGADQVAWLLEAAPGYFEVIGADVVGPPVDRQVEFPPAGGAPRTRRR